MILLFHNRSKLVNKGAVPSDVKPETVLITGASSGIGNVTALYLAERGYRVIATSRSMERLTDLVQTASLRNLSITPVEMDINRNEGVDRAVPRLLSEFGTIDVLVNNAGYSVWGPVQSLSISEIKTLFETNYFAAIRLTKAVLPGMIEQGSGKIINISSVLGRLGTPFMGAYASTKFALEGLSESLRTELLPLGVHVSLVEPGIFKTGFQANQLMASGTEAASGSPYGPYIENYRANHDTYNLMSSDPVKVSQVIHKIIRSKNPAFRYAVGIEARLGIMGARLLPERLFHMMLSRATVK